MPTTVTEFVNDKDRGGSTILDPTPEQYRPPTYQGATSLDVHFQFYAEHPYDAPNQVSVGCGNLFDAVDEARRIYHETGRQTQVRINLEIDDEGRYLEEIALLPERQAYRATDDAIVQMHMRESRREK